MLSVRRAHLDVSLTSWCNFSYAVWTSMFPLFRIWLQVCLLMASVLLSFQNGPNNSVVQDAATELRSPHVFRWIAAFATDSGMIFLLLVISTLLKFCEGQSCLSAAKRLDACSWHSCPLLTPSEVPEWIKYKVHPTVRCSCDKQECWEMQRSTWPKAQGDAKSLSP